MVAKQHGWAQCLKELGSEASMSTSSASLSIPGRIGPRSALPCAHHKMALEVSNPYPPALQSEAGLRSLSCLSFTSLVEVSRVPEPGGGAPPHSLGNLEMPT